MKFVCTVLLVAVPGIAAAQARTLSEVSASATTGPYTLDDALRAAGISAPTIEAASSGIDAARAGRVVAGLRPNPQAQVQVENVLGSGPYTGLESAETTVGVA